MTATCFAIASRGQLSADQVSFIGEQKESAALRRDANARAISLCGHAIRAPKLLAGGRFQAHQRAACSVAIDVFALENMIVERRLPSPIAFGLLRFAA